jgi:hypothetical protein
MRAAPLDASEKSPKKHSTRPKVSQERRVLPLLPLT